MSRVMAVGSEVFGSCFGEIYVSVGMENEDCWLRCKWKNMRLFWGGKVAQDWQKRWWVVVWID